MKASRAKVADGGTLKERPLFFRRFAEQVLSLIHILLLCVLGAAGWIIYNGVQDSMERKAGAALVAAMPESPADVYKRQERNSLLQETPPEMERVR